MIYLIQQTYFDEENNKPIKLLKISGFELVSVKPEYQELYNTLHKE